MSLILSKTTNFIAAIGLFVVLIAGCDEKETVSDEVSKYYIDALGWAGGGKVYVYDPVSDPSLPREIWHYRYIPDLRGNSLWSARYDQSGNIIQRSVENIRNDGSELRSIDLHVQTETGLFDISPKINANKVIAFGRIQDRPSSTLQIEYWDTTSDSVRVILTKQRTIAQESTFNIDGQDFPSIIVLLTETLETETEGFTTTEWRGTEIYVEHLGLVYYNKYVNEDIQLEYMIRDILTFDQFSTGNSLQSESHE